MNGGTLMQRATLILSALALLLGSVQKAEAGILTTMNDTSANDLAAALTSGGAGGITVTGATLSTNTSAGSVASSGIFTTVGTNNYGLTGSGIVISSGNAAQDGTTGPFIEFVSTQFGTNATPSQFNLLHQVSPASSSFHDVTELDITFTAGPTTSQIFFNAVFGSAEYPVYVGQFIDGFGLFLNGTNIAFAGGQPTNINSTSMVNTGYPVDGGVNGSQFQTTPLGGLLVSNGSPVVTYSGSVIPGSTGNTLTFIIGDANDSALDTTAFIQSLGNAPPVASVPEPSTFGLVGAGILMRLGYLGWRRRKQAVPA
jgi:hypothetical protein